MTYFLLGIRYAADYNFYHTWKDVISEFRMGHIQFGLGYALGMLYYTVAKRA